MYIFKEINICAKIQLIWIKYTNIRYQKYVIFAQIMHVLPEKRCCEARGCTHFQITDQLCNCKHIVCKIFAYNITSGCFNDINQQSAFGYIYIAKVKAHDFYR